MTPLLRVVRGDASAEEIAALVAVLAAAGGAPDAPPPPPRPQWASRAALVRAPTAPGPSAWRHAGRSR